MRRGALTIVVAAAAAAFAAAPAKGAITLGETKSVNEACAAPTVIVQTLVGPGLPSYTVPAGGGVITSWQHQARDITNAQLKFKVLRPTSTLLGPATFSVVGESAFQGVSEPQLYSFPVRIPVIAGDRIGLAMAPNAPDAPPACRLGGESNQDEVYEGPDFTGSGTLNPANTFRLNISATMEPDADVDGFGDETQDNCRGSAGANNGCPATKAVPEQAKKKKCKKGKKKRKKGKGASAAAKKCGKGKKKKKKK